MLNAMNDTSPVSAGSTDRSPAAALYDPKAEKPLGLDEALQLLGLPSVGTPALIIAAYKRRDTALAESASSQWPAALRERAAQRRSRLSQARDILMAEAERNAVPNVGRPGVIGMAGRESSSEGETQQSPQDDLVGTVLANRYEVLEFIGEGGMGRVFRAFDRIKQSYVALKVISPELVRQKGAQERFVTEAKLACSLSHPNIIRVHDVCADDDGYFITMELLHGQTLRSRMDQQKRSRRPFPLDQGLAMALDLLGGLAFAHLQLVHRDIKPENIWVCDDGTVKLMDFGVAQSLQGERRTRTLQSVGSAYYVAPEQLRGLPLDHRADQYSLAVVLYELFSGRVPTGVARALGEERPDLPASAAAAVMRALNPSPEDRFATTEDFRRRFERTPWHSSLLPSSTLGRRWLAAGVTALALGVAAMATVAWEAVAFPQWHLIETANDRDTTIESQASVALLFGRADNVAAERQASLKALEERAARAIAPGRGNSPMETTSDDLVAVRSELDLWTGLLYPAAAQIGMQSRRAMADAALKEGRFVEARETFEQLRAWLAPRVAALPRLPQLARARADALNATAGTARSEDDRLARALAAFSLGDVRVAEARADEAIAAYRDAVALRNAVRETEQEHIASLARVRAAEARAQAEVAAKVQATKAAAMRKEAGSRAELARSGRQFRDRLASGGEGPMMVVLPGGSAESGEAVARSASTITAGELSRFIQARGRPLHLQDLTALYRDPAPVDPDVVSPADAREYATWLGQETGQRYRVAQTRQRTDIGVTFWVARDIEPRQAGHTH